MAKGDKETKYPDGYWPKIEYWAEKYLEAVKARDTEAMIRASEKERYFVIKQGIEAGFE